MAVLETPSHRYRNAFLSAARDYDQAGEDNWFILYRDAFDDFDIYLEQLQNSSLGIGLKPGRVPMSYFWLVEGGDRIVGISRVRHFLTPSLEIEGGHIGYDVPPSQRRKGYGNQLLQLTLLKAKELKLSRTLLTVDDDNIASINIIEKNGGQLEFKGWVQSANKTKRRYWIQLQP